MSQSFHAFVPTRNLPENSQIGRALSSRGWAVELPESPAICDATGNFVITVDGQEVSLEIGIQKVGDISDTEWTTLGDHAAKVIKTTDVRVSLSGTDETSTRWSRDMARGLALLALGAFHDSTSGKTLHYGY